MLVRVASRSRWPVVAWTIVWAFAGVIWHPAFAAFHQSVPAGPSARPAGALTAAKPAAHAAPRTKTSSGRMPTPRSARARWLSRRLAELTNDHWRIRRDAFRRLMRCDPRILPVLLQRLRQTQDPELIQRLTTLACQLYMAGQFNRDAGPQPFLGIAFSVRLMSPRIKLSHPRAAVVVQEVLPGFAAARYLAPGDLIVAVNGRPFPAAFTALDFRSLIQSRSVGARIQLTVLRHGRQHVYRLHLNGVPADPVRINQMLQQRWLRERMFLRRYNRWTNLVLNAGARR